MKKTMVAFGLLIILPVFLSAAEPVFRITSPVAGRTVVDDYGLINLKLYLEVSKPVSDADDELLDQFDDRRFSVLVNGIEKKVSWRGSGNGSSDVIVYQDKDIAFSPGPEAGIKKIEVVLGNFKREVTVNYQPVTRLSPVGVCNGMAIFNTTATCTFVATNIKPSRLMVNINDEPVVDLTAQRFSGTDNLVQLVIPADKYFKRGRNQVLLMATDTNDQDTDCFLILYYYPGGENQPVPDRSAGIATIEDLYSMKSEDYTLLAERQIPLGDEFLVEYGYPGGKSGPWFGCDVSGEALKVTGYRADQVMPWTVDGFGSVYPEAPHLANIAAVKTGSGSIRIFVTPHFTMPEQLKTEIPVAVYDPRDQSALSAWEDFVADGNAFRCKLPAVWKKEVSTRDDADKVYGVLVAAARTWEDVVPYIQVEYYPKGNLLHKTARRFFASHLDPRFDQEGETSSAITVVTVNGKKCWYFDQLEFEYFPKREINPAGILTVKKFYVIPETDKSFFVLRLCAPADNVSYYQPFFDQVVKSFKPQAIKKPRKSKRIDRL